MGYYSADPKYIPPISEMSPESTPAELYSPPVDGEDTFDYSVAGQMRRRGATRDRDSSGNNTPHIPIAELSGEDTIRPLYNEKNRSLSDTSPKTNIDEVLAKRPLSEARANLEVASSSVNPGDPATAEEIAKANTDATAALTNDEHGHESAHERRPSHTRGLSDVTVQSISTAVSQPTPEELEHWASAGDGSGRPMSP